MEKKEYLNINVAILNSTFFTLIPLVGILMIPDRWWGWLIRIILGLIILGSLRNLFFHPMWSKVIGFGAGVSLNMLWFVGIWFLWPHWSIFIFAVLILLGLATMKRILKERYTNNPTP